MLAPDIGHVYPKTGLDADLRFDSTPTYVSSGSVYLADETDDCVSCDGVKWTNTNDWSITFWFKSSSASMSDSEVLWGMLENTGSKRYSFYFTRTDTYGFTFFEENSGSGGNTLLDLSNGGSSGDTRLVDGQWHHFALVMTNSGLTATVYVDGQSWATGSMNNAPDMSDADVFSIGADHNEGTPFGGNMCHFGIWNNDLTQAQVRAVMGASTYAEAVTASGTTALFYWSLETDADASVGGVDGTLRSGAVMVGDRARLPSGLDLTSTQLNAQVFSGRAAAFDSGGGDELIADAYTDSSNFYSLSLWFKATNHSANRAAFTNGSDAVDVEHGLLWMQSGVIRYHYQDSTADYHLSSDYAQAAGMWNHVVVTVDGSTASAYDAKMYVNGKLQTTSKSTTGAGWAADDGLGIGNQHGHTQHWLGAIADVRLFNVELTAAQALELYTVPEQILPTSVSTSALKRWYPLSDYDISGDNNLAGLILQDCSGNAKNLTATNCGMEFNQPTIPQMGLRSSTSLVYFGGPSSGDYCESSDTDLVTNTFSFSIWVNVFSNAGGYAGIITGNDAANDYDEGITINLGNDASSAVDHISVEGQGFTKADQYSGSIPFGQWFHLAFTSNASTYVTYINGSQVNSASRTNTTANKLDIIRLGARYYSSAVQAASQFDGLITGCGVFNAVIDSDSVAAIHAAGIGADIRSDISNYDQSSALVHFWKTDNPVTCLDLEGSDNLTVNGSPNIATVPESTTSDLSSFGSLTRKHYSGMLSGVNVYGRTATGSASAGCGAILPTPDMGTGNWTISFWFRMMQPASTDMSLFYSYTGTIGFDMFFTGSTRLNYTVKGASAGTTTGYATLTVADYVEKWCHVVYRREGTSVISHYFKPLDAAAITAGDMNDYTVDIGSLTASEPHFGIGISTRAGSMFYANAAGADFADFRIFNGDALTDAQVNATHEQGARMLRGT